MSDRRADEHDGPAMEYDPEWKGPLGVERKLTDFPFLIAYESCLAVWIIVGIFVFAAARLGEDKLQTQKADNADFEDVTLSSIIYMVLLGTVVAIVVSTLCILLLNYNPLSIFLIPLVSLGILLLFVIIVSLYDPDFAREFFQVPNHVDMALFVLFVLFFFIVLVVTPAIGMIVYWKKIGIACAVIQEATKAVFHLPALFFFSILSCLLRGLALTFATIIFTSLVELESREGTKKKGIFILLQFFNLFVFSWTMSWIIGFSLMVFYGSFSAWYWSTDKAQIKSDVILKFISITGKFHAGTAAAYGSLLVVFFKLFGQALEYPRGGMIYLLEYYIINDAWTKPGNEYILEFFKSYAAWLVVIIEVYNQFTYLMCIVHGTEFRQSAKDSSNLLFERHFMKLFLLYSLLLLIQYIAMPFVTSCIIWIVFSLDDDLGVAPIQIDAVSFSSTIVLMIFWTVIKSAILTIFVSVVEDYDRNDGFSQRSEFMPNQLKELFEQEIRVM